VGNNAEVADILNGHGQFANIVESTRRVNALGYHRHSGEIAFRSLPLIPKPMDRSVVAR